MNKLILISAVLFCTLRAEAQSIKERDVPADVLISFNKINPTASKVKWENEDGMYEGSFQTDKKETSLLFSRDGVLVQTENEISLTELPAGVVDYVSKQHPGATMKEASKVTDIKGVVNYEVEVADVDFLFSSTGQFIRQEKEAEGKD